MDIPKAQGVTWIGTLWNRHALATVKDPLLQEAKVGCITKVGFQIRNGSHKNEMISSSKFPMENQVFER